MPLLPGPTTAMSAGDEIEFRSCRRIDLKNLEWLIRYVAQRMRHSSRDKDHLVFPDRMDLAVGDELALAAANDIDVVGLAVLVQAAARSARDEAIEMDIKRFGAERRVDQLDLAAPALFHRLGDGGVKVDYFQHLRSPSVLALKSWR